MTNTRRGRKKVARRSAARKQQGAGRPAKRIKARAEPQVLSASIFTVRNADLERLTPEGAVELLRDLLWAEAGRVGLPKTSINVSSWVDMPDGGVDATFEGIASAARSAVLKQRRTGFQVKAGAGFQPWNDSHVRKALFGDKSSTKESLGPAVRA